MSESILISIIISLVGVIIAVVSSSFIAGSKYGMLITTMNAMESRLAKIEGMFQLKLRDPSD